VTCTCGHNRVDEHGNDPHYPGSTACNVEGCDCIAFEWDGNPEGEEE
jgi:hypothetical protein